MVQVAYRVNRGRQKFARHQQIKNYMEDWLEKDAKPHFVGRFEMVVANWKTQVTFKARKFFRVDHIAVNVFPDKGKEIWGYVVKGTRPHQIRPKGPWMLRFKTGYKPKTLPKAKFGGPGTSTGPTVFAKMVNHPGSKPRPFPEEIAKDEKPWFSRNANNAWRRAIRSL